MLDCIRGIIPLLWKFSVFKLYCSTEGEPRAAVRARARGNADRVRINETAIRIRAAVRTANDTAPIMCIIEYIGVVLIPR